MLFLKQPALVRRILLEASKLENLHTLVLEDKTREHPYNQPRLDEPIHEPTFPASLQVLRTSLDLKLNFKAEQMPSHLKVFQGNVGHLFGQQSGGDVLVCSSTPFSDSHLKCMLYMCGTVYTNLDMSVNLAKSNCKTQEP